MSYLLHHGDCLEVMAGMEPGSVDAVVTDPPYGLNFMGKKWDAPGSFVERRPETGTTFDHIGGNHHACNPHDGARSTGRAQDWHHAWAVAALRVLKPSHYLLVFGGTRTWHRLACALEDAGFEIRDTLMWLYGSGFPKGKACLKPAWEPVILARKPGPMRELGIEECRIDTPVDSYATPGNGLGCSDVYGGWGGKYEGASERHPESVRHHVAGRWPANLVLDEEAGRELDGAVGVLTSGVGAVKRSTAAGYHGNALGAESRPEGTPMVEYGDSGGPSRFFKTVPGPSPCGDHVPCGECINREDCDYAGDYACPVPGCHGTGMHFCPQDDSEPVARFKYVPKASRAERNKGLEGMEERVASVGNTEAAGRNPDNERNYIGGKQDRVAAGLSPTLPRQNHHPTVKPVALMQWLVRLVARDGDLVLDPFLGSGTTGIAAVTQGRNFVGIEKEAEYVEIARRRIEAAAAQERLPV